MLTTRDIVYCALFAALVAALGLLPPIPLGFLPVPITAQTLGVMLAGLMLGGHRAAIALILFVLLVAAGLPLLAGGRGGLGALLGPSGGFVLGWIPGAYVTGVLAQRFAPGGRPLGLFVCCVAGGVVAVYALGVPWLAFAGNMPLAKAATGVLAFVPGDLVKAAAAAIAVAAVRRAGVAPAFR